MNTLTSNLAGQLEYFTPGQIECGLGAFLFCVQKYSSRTNYQAIELLISESEKLLEKFKHTPEQEHVGNLLALSGSLFGVKSHQLQTLMNSLSKSGYSTIMVARFLPTLLCNLQRELSNSVFLQLQKDIPGLNKFIYQSAYSRMHQMVH